MAYIYDIADTWAASGTVFTGIKLNVTDTASAAGSLLMDLQVGGSSKFKVDKGGSLYMFGDASPTIGSSSGFTTIGSPGNGQLFGPSGGTLTSSSVRIDSGTLRLKTALSFGWTGGDLGGASDTVLARDAANTLAQRNGVNAQAFNLYNTYTDASNYERGFMRWVGNVLQIGAEKAGTGTQRTVRLVNIPINTLWAESEFANYGLNFNNSGELVSVINGNPKASIGTNIVVSNSGQFAFTSTSSSSGARDTGLAREDASIVRVTNGFTGGGAMQLTEMTAPAAPATNNVRIYAEDDGTGKTRLMALFPTGVAQQIAIEP